MKLYVIEWFESGEWQPATFDVYVNRAVAGERRDILRRTEKLYPGRARRIRVSVYERAPQPAKAAKRKRR